VINPLKLLGALVDFALPMQASAVQRAAMAHGAFGVDAEAARERLVEREAEEDVREGYSLDEVFALRDQQVAEKLKHSHRVTYISEDGDEHRDQCSCGYEMLTFSREAADREWDAHLDDERAASPTPSDMCATCGHTQYVHVPGGCNFNDHYIGEPCICPAFLDGPPKSSPAAEAGAVACPPEVSDNPLSPSGGTTIPSHPPTITAHRGACGEDCGADRDILPSPAPQYPITLTLDQEFAAADYLHDIFAGITADGRVNAGWVLYHVRAMVKRVNAVTK
jgi:hypothetical protein